MMRRRDSLDYYYQQAFGGKCSISGLSSSGSEEEIFLLFLLGPSVSFVLHPSSPYIFFFSLKLKRKQTLESGRQSRTRHRTRDHIDGLKGIW